MTHEQQRQDIKNHCIGTKMQTQDYIVVIALAASMAYTQLFPFSYPFLLFHFKASQINPMFSAIVRPPLEISNSIGQTTRGLRSYY